jgi:AcrR family transcriptional regulator
MDKRERIYEKALSLFVEAGYDHTPMSRLARELNLTKAGLYHYFGSKEELLYLIHEYYLQKDFIPIVEAAERLSDPEERIAYFLRNYTRAVTTGAGRVLVHEVKRLEPEHWRKITQVWKRAYELIRGAVVEMAESGKGKPLNPAYATFAAIGMASWVHYWFDYSRKESAGELAETLVEIFFDGLRSRD